MSHTASCAGSGATIPAQGIHSHPTGDREGAGNFPSGIAEQPPGTPRIIQPGAPNEATKRQLRRAAMRAAGLYGVRLVEIIASCPSGFCFMGGARLAEKFDLDPNRGARGSWSGFRDALVRLVRAGVVVRFSCDRATGSGSGKGLRVLVFGDPVEGGSEMRRPSWVDDRGAAIELPRPGGACAGVRVLRVGVDLVEVPAPAPRKRKPATSRATETTGFDTSDVPILTRSACPQSQTVIQTSPKGSATASGADLATLPDPETLAAISTTAIVPTAEPAPDVPRGDTESAHEAGHVFALDAESPTIAPIESGASPDPTVGATADRADGAIVAQKSRRSRGPKTATPKTDRKSMAPKTPTGAGAVVAAWCDEWQRATGRAWSRRGADGGHARNLWAIEANVELWRRAFRLALAIKWHRAAEDPIRAFLSKRNAFAARAAREIADEESRRRLDAASAAQRAADDATKADAPTADEIARKKTVVDDYHAQRAAERRARLAAELAAGAES